MTETRNWRTVGTGREKRTAGTRRKAVLSCTECDHTSPPDGDWNRHPSDSGIELRCPVCQELLTVR